MLIEKSPRVDKDLLYNFVVNLIDGGFFGGALGFASFVTVIPLFVKSLAGSAILIALVPAIHAVGWQLPQLLTANRVSRLRRYKPMVLLMTINERVPFLGLALIAWFAPSLGNANALWLTYVMLMWQGLGGGFAATAWQSMIAKIMPPRRRGTFFGAQAAASNLLAGGAAIVAGLVLAGFDSPFDYTACFLLASVCMSVSFYFLARTREPDAEPARVQQESPADFRRELLLILRRDRNFRWFMLARAVSQLAVVGFGFYTVYAVERYGMSETLAGVMTFVLFITQVVANPLMGAIADRWSHRGIMQIGLLAAAASALMAWFATSAAWFYAVFVLAGIANVAIWTIGMAMTLEFGGETERPAYIGLANTLVAPATLLVPFAGGWLADQAGYPAAFLLSAAGGLISAALLGLAVRNPRELAAQP